MSPLSPPYGCISLLIDVSHDVSEMLFDPKEPSESSKKYYIKLSNICVYHLFLFKVPIHMCYASHIKYTK